jgi:hypothetical protein
MDELNQEEVLESPSAEDFVTEESQEEEREEDEGGSDEGFDTAESLEESL